MIPFWKNLRLTYAESLAFLVACPLLALLPVAFELLQHVAEVHIGLYASAAAFQALGGNPLRLVLGFVKSVALVIPVYWVVRFLAHRGGSSAGRAEATPVRLFAGFLLVQTVISAIDLFALPRSSAATIISLVAGQVLDGLLCGWAVAAPLGNPNVGPLASIRFMAPRLPWTLAFLVIAQLPLMILHYLLAGFAIVSARRFLWPILIGDSLVVGYLALVLAASAYFAALRAASLASVALIPSPAAGPAGLQSPDPG